MASEDQNIKLSSLSNSNRYIKIELNKQCEAPISKSPVEGRQSFSVSEDENQLLNHF